MLFHLPRMGERREWGRGLRGWGESKSGKWKTFCAFFCSDSLILGKFLIHSFIIYKKKESFKLLIQHSCAAVSLTTRFFLHISFTSFSFFFSLFIFSDRQANKLTKGSTSLDGNNSIEFNFTFFLAPTAAAEGGKKLVILSFFILILPFFFACVVTSLEGRN